MNQKYFEWINHAGLDEALAKELRGCAKDKQEIEDRFYCSLAFGTGGLRGVIGAGTNRMNIYTVAKATRGLAAYLKNSFSEPSCAIAYDSRIKSDEFAKVTAATLATEGVKAFLYAELMPTPMLSFAVRYLHCSGGVVITASHNPATYNGYKVYGSDGCQITIEAAEEIQKYIAKQPDFAPEALDYEALLQSGAVRFIEEEVIDAYFAAVRSLGNQAPQLPLHIVYSPLNGTGCKPVQRALKELGGVRVTVVPQQEKPDGAFPTCPYPNPEIKEAMHLASELATKTNADFCLATDPDCDRVGVGVPTEHGVRLINGNEMGVMLFEYLCRRHIAAGTMPDRPVAVKTIVTTEMASAVAREYGVELRNVLTGFKFIGEQIGLLDNEGESQRYIFGFEESYGYLAGDFVRDKDAVIGSVLICEMAAYYKAQGKSLLDVLCETYQKYGYYKTSLLSFEFASAEGMWKMQDILNRLRTSGPSKLEGRAVVEKIDYQNDCTGLPKSNVLRFSLEGGSYCIIRPSGTEPKLKIYVTAVGKTEESTNNLLTGLCGCCREMIERT